MSKRMLLSIMCLPLAWYAGMEAFRVARHALARRDGTAETLKKDLEELRAETKSKWALRPALFSNVVGLTDREPSAADSEGEQSLSQAFQEYASKMEELRLVVRAGDRTVAGLGQDLQKRVAVLRAQKPLAMRIDQDIDLLCGSIRKGIELQAPEPGGRRMLTDPHWAEAIADIRKANDALFETYFAKRGERNRRFLAGCEAMLQTLRSAEEAGVRNEHFARLDRLVTEAEREDVSELPALARSLALYWLGEMLPQTRYDDKAWICFKTRDAPRGKWAAFPLTQIKTHPKDIITPPGRKFLASDEDLQFQERDAKGERLSWWVSGLGDEAKKCPTSRSLLTRAFRKVEKDHPPSFKRMHDFLTRLEEQYREELAKHAPFAGEDSPVRDWDNLRSECPEIWPSLERARELVLQHKTLCRDDP